MSKQLNLLDTKIDILFVPKQLYTCTHTARAVRKLVTHG
jgi:hypothetical protein